MANNITVEDFKLICRVCLKMSNNLILISEYQIIKMMLSCTSVQIWLNDDLPNHLCQSCLIELQNAFNFKQRSENSDNNLRQILNKNLINQGNCDNENKYFHDNFETNSIKDESYLENETEIKTEDVNDTKNIIQNSDLKYDCNECDFKFSHLRHLGLHMKRYHRSKGQQCPKCGSVFYSSLQLEQHIRTHRDKIKSKKCNVCNKTFKTPSKLIRHSVVHDNERPYQCSQCEKTFKLDSALKIHKNIAHSAKDDWVPCDVCGKHVLKRHIQRHLIIHKNNRDLTQCDKCDKKFLHRSSLKQHVKRDHDKIIQELNHLCNTCGKKYSSRIALERHSVTHKPDRPYQCTECSKSFKLNFILTKHMRTMHLNTTNNNIRIPCKVCGKQISKTNMQTHLKIHRNDRNLIKCEQCSKEFLHQISLKLHVRRDHENIPRDLKHLCSICGRGAGCRAELEVHMRSHSDEKTFECDKCGMKYKSRPGLTHHVKTTHLNIRPYACALCSQHFALKATLASHMRTHTGERPFHCIVCEKSFSQKSSLRTHMKLVH